MKKEYVLNEYFHRPQNGETTTMRISYREGDEGVYVSIYKGKTGAVIKLNPMEVHDIIHTLEGVARALRWVRTQRLTQKREDYLLHRQKRESPQKQYGVSRTQMDVVAHDITAPQGHGIASERW